MLTMTNFSRLSLTSVFIIYAQVAHAIVPAAPYQIYCLSDAKFVGTVVEGSSRDCRLRLPKGSSCSPDGVTRLAVKVSEVIGSSGPVHVGDTIITDIAIRTDQPTMIGGRMVRFSTEETGTLDFPLTGEPASDAEVRAKLLGQKLLFSMTGSSTGGVNWARAWRMDQADRLRGMWLGKLCAAKTP